jgi:hypothetical protein
MTIGQKKQIAFELDFSDRFQELRNLKFYLGNRLISNESIYVPTYLESFERFTELLINGQFQKGKMKGLTAGQSFERVVNERDSDESQYFNHLLQVDETIDQYIIFVFQSNNFTELVWTCWDEHNCNSDHVLNKVYSTSIKTIELITILNELTNELNKTTR